MAKKSVPKYITIKFWCGRCQRSAKVKAKSVNTGIWSHLPEGWEQFGKLIRCDQCKSTLESLW